MPDVDGIQVFERARELDPALPDAFVFMTGGAFSDRAREFLAACKNPRLEKPFDLETVFAMIDDL